MIEGEYTAVLDRFEDDLAVLVLERDGESIEELAVPERELPDDARRVDAVLTVEVEAGDLVAAEFDPEETDRRARTAQERFDDLAERPPGSDEEG